MFGLGVLLVAQIALFLISGIGMQGIINLPIFLPSPRPGCHALFARLADLVVGISGTQPPGGCWHVAFEFAGYCGPGIKPGGLLNRSFPFFVQPNLFR